MTEKKIVSFSKTDLAQLESTNQKDIEVLAIPWEQYSDSYVPMRFVRGSFHRQYPHPIPVLLDHKHHDVRSIVGHVTGLQDTDEGLVASLTITCGGEDERRLRALIAAKSLTGVSCGLELREDTKYENDDNGDSIVVFANAHLIEISFVTFPALINARIKDDKPETDKAQEGLTQDTNSVETLMSQYNKATLEEQHMTENSPENMSETITAAVTAAVSAAFAAQPVASPMPIPAPHAADTTATSNTVTKTRPLYGMGSDHSFVRDVWAMHKEHGAVADSARHRLSEYQDSLVALAAETTTSLRPLIPTQPMPGMYIGGDARPEALAGLFSRGTLVNATPFTLPILTGTTNLIRPQVEGTNGAEGQLTMSDKTITPEAVDGLVKLTRQAFESSNPAIDQIVAVEMQNSYLEELEVRCAAVLNATVPTLPTAAYTGATALYDGVRDQLVKTNFRRGGRQINRIALPEAPFSALSNAKTTTGQPLLPAYDSGNVSGRAVVSEGTLDLDNRPVTGAWALTTAGYMFAERSAWLWTSPVQGFRFEERSGPAIVEIAAFGYVATAFLKASDMVKITYTP